MKIKYDSAFLIVLYNKQPMESETIKKIIFFESIGNDKIVIWNNGPKQIKFDEYPNIDVVNTIENFALSKIYNRFISTYNASRYVILDDDSNITIDYWHDVSTVAENKLGIPLITDELGVLRSPSVNGHPGKNIDNGLVIGIGSGLVLGRKVCLELSAKYTDIFDERFIFYGVDTTLFYRFRECFSNRDLTLICGFEHRLSRLDQKDASSKFRLIERGFDVGMRLRYYHSKTDGLTLLIKHFLSNLKLSLSNKKRLSIKSLLKGYFIGKHDRS
ncbi:MULTISPECIES: hypothetical protein [Vibrio]|uniref:hypothetical protein n=1 Tax=Vibrio TaxID=662 RepID=UPI0006991832|nr:MULTISPECIES: hypothetical protein [Vibrio]QCI72098.1 hypothetical protein FAZ90_14035 [Vibrio cyclitrophicus]